MRMEKMKELGTQGFMGNKLGVKERKLKMSPKHTA